MQQAIKLVDLFIHVPLNPGRNDCRYVRYRCDTVLAGCKLKKAISEQRGARL
jgi:hypothetical protein